jgi:hypothetical protein
MHFKYEVPIFLSDDALAYVRPVVWCATQLEILLHDF